MAIDPSIAYPSNTDPPEPDYPWGKARNVLSPGDYTGTPWEAALANDIFGFQQALLDQAGILPTGLSDTARASQYLQGIGKLHKRTLINFSALRAYDAVLNDQVVFVAGAVTAGDGAQGSFRYVSGMAPGTYVDDNDKVILLTGSDGSDAFLRIDDTPYYTDSGSANNYILSRADGLSSYADDMTVVFKPVSDNTGASVVNINSVGAVDLVASDGSALVGGEIKTDQYIVCRYRTSTGKFEIVISDGGLMHLAGAETVTGTKTISTSGAPLTLNRSAANGLLYLQKGGVTGGLLGTDATDIIFYNGASAERMRLSSAGNLQFSGTLAVGGTSGTINGSDILTAADIVEGTFTPVIEGSTTAGVGTYAIQFGSYQKLGSWINFRIQLSWTAHTGTGNMRVSGLPYTSNVNRVSTASIIPFELTFSNLLGAQIPSNSNTIRLYSYASGATYSEVAIDTAGQVQITGTYEAA